MNAALPTPLAPRTASLWESNFLKPMAAYYRAEADFQESVHCYDGEQSLAQQEAQKEAHMATD